MKKEEIINLAQHMGFHLDYDQWDNKGWLRFQLDDKLDEKDLRWIYNKNYDFGANLRVGANILFKAGQKYKASQINEYTSIYDLNPGEDE